MFLDHSDTKTSKTLKDTQEKLGALKISGDHAKGYISFAVCPVNEIICGVKFSDTNLNLSRTPQTENVEKKKKRRKKTQSADQVG